MAVLSNCLIEEFLRCRFLLDLLVRSPSRLIRAPKSASILSRYAWAVSRVN